MGLGLGLGLERVVDAVEVVARVGLAQALVACGGEGLGERHALDHLVRVRVRLRLGLGFGLGFGFGFGLGVSDDDLAEDEGDGGGEAAGHGVDHIARLRHVLLGVGGRVGVGVGVGVRVRVS